MPTPAVVPPTLLVLLVEQDGMPMLATIYQRLSESKELPWRALLLGVIVVGGLMIGIGGKTDDGWHTIYWYESVLILTAQMSHTTRSFFMGEGTAPWLRVPSWRRHRCCPARLGPGLLHALGGAPQPPQSLLCVCQRRPCCACQAQASGTSCGTSSLSTAT